MRRWAWVVQGKLGSLTSSHPELLYNENSLISYFCSSLTKLNRNLSIPPNSCQSLVFGNYQVHNTVTMKYSYAAFTVLALAGHAAAVIPACATKCISDAVASSTTCGATDLSCQCQAANQAKIQSAATSCVLSACGDQALSKILQCLCMWT
jgi:hypothetical protein